MKIKKRNEILYYVSTTLYNTALIVASGAVLQTFMLEVGINENSVAQMISIFQAVQSAAMIIFSGLLDKVQKVIRVTAFCMLNLLPLLITMLFFSMFDGFKESANVTILIMGCISNILLGIYNVISYKLPYHIMRMDEYGKISACSGVLYGGTGIAASIAMTYFLGKYEYFNTMKIILFVSICMTIIACIIALKYVKISDNISKKEKNKINIFKYEPFLKLIIPNFTRGVGMGIIGVTVTIGYYFKIIDKLIGSYIVVITNIAIILSCLLYSRIAKRGRNGGIIIISSIVVFVFTSLMMVGNSTRMFLICYSIAYFAVYLIMLAVPVVVTELIDYQVIGQYTAWRMMLFTVGVSVGGFLSIPMSEKFGGIVTFACSGLMFLITGIGYFTYEQKNKKCIRERV
ncbi:MAG: MFS transporter [Clostridia bacterium]|nr:MFS transporter [Clostridia bacterium]